MLDRFLGDNGRRLRVDALMVQKLISGNKQIAEELADLVELLAIKKGAVLIEQDGSDNDVYFIVSGSLEILINRRHVRYRGPSDHVGEMAAIEPTQRRSATVIAHEDCVVAKLTEPNFNAVASRHPEIYRHVAKELSKRLMQRNALISAARDKIRVFIISSSEALPIARAIQNAFAYDPFDVVIWSDGVFKVTNYTLQSLEDEVDRSDFAIAIAHADDLTQSRGQDWPSPRDNVIFELGLFMGRLGRRRAILMEPREERVKLPSDMAGVTTILYRYSPGGDVSALMGSACNLLRDHINGLGPNN